MPDSTSKDASGCLSSRSALGKLSDTIWKVLRHIQPSYTHASKDLTASMNPSTSRIVRLLRSLLAFALMLVAVSPAPTFAQAPAQGTPHIAVATNLQFALPEIVAAFTRSGGAPMRISFGSSGNFARQIVQGAPFELFLSADERVAAVVVAASRAEGVAVPLNQRGQARIKSATRIKEELAWANVSNGHPRVAVCFAVRQGEKCGKQGTDVVLQNRTTH